MVLVWNYGLSSTGVPLAQSLIHNNDNHDGRDDELRTRSKHTNTSTRINLQIIVTIVITVIDRDNRLFVLTDYG